MPGKGTPVRTVRVPDSLWDAAVARAEAEGTNVRAVLLRLLEAWVNR